MKKPFISGLNHLGIIVDNMAVAREWFIDTLGLKVLEDRGGLVLMLAGQDVIAIKTKEHAVAKPEFPSGEKEPVKGLMNMDHYGFFAPSREAVDLFADFIQEKGAKIIKGPYDRSDGRSVYFKDPCGNVGEYFYFS